MCTLFSGVVIFLVVTLEHACRGIHLQNTFAHMVLLPPATFAAFGRHAALVLVVLSHVFIFSSTFVTPYIPQRI